jgi:hypothetical protein
MTSKMTASLILAVSACTLVAQAPAEKKGPPRARRWSGSRSWRANGSARGCTAVWNAM